MADVNYRYELDNNTVTVISYRGAKWSDEDKEILDREEFNVDDVPAQLETSDGAKSIAGYGLLKLLQDRTSDVKGEAKLPGMREHFEVFKAGKWREYAERSATGGKWLIRAIAALKGADEDAVRETLAAMNEDARKDLEKAPAVKAKIAELKAEDARAAAESAEGDDPLAGLNF